MKDYFYINSENKQKGPVSPEKFAALGITADTLVWTQGMKDWERAGIVSELHDWLAEPSPRTQSVNSAEGSAPPQHDHVTYTAGNGTAPEATPYTANGNGYTTGRARYGDTVPPCPNNHMAWAILTTICCCLPLGIVAIVKASQVNTFYVQGFYDQALLAADDAKNWCLWALVCGILSFGSLGVLGLL